MSIARIVTRGFGSFSDVNELPVRGFTVGVAVSTVYGGRFVAGHAFLPGMQRATVAKTGFAEGAVHNPGFQQAGATR